ncbi:MAG: mechanosensitive ion channel family protein, partial [Chloroflexota bacterium]
MDIDPTVQKLEAMLDGFFAALPNLILAAIVFVLLYLLSGVLRRNVRRLAERSRRGAYAGRILGRLVQWATILFAVLIAFSIIFPSLSAETLIGVLGIGSLAIGFAFRDIAENFLAGILILITQPFKLGDQIVVDEFEGTVQNIEVRATKI